MKNNTSDEILYATKEMLEQINQTNDVNKKIKEQTENQKKFSKFCTKYNDIYMQSNLKPLANISSYFIDKHKDLLS